jgi:hypothetical protein
MIVYSAMSNSVVQSFTPGPLRGRVMSLYLWVFLGTTPLGSLLFGAIEQAWGSQVAMGLAGSGAMLTALGGSIWWSRRSRRERSYPSGSVAGRPTAAPTA